MRQSAREPTFRSRFLFAGVDLLSVNKDKIPDYYRNPAVADAFHKDRYGGATGAWFIEMERAIFAEFAAGYSSNASMLDLGTGSGKLFSAVKPRFIVGLDCSLPMLIVSRNAGILSPLVLGDSCALPFPDNSFDLVMASRLLLHVPSWEAMVSECCRVARSAVLIDFPIRPSLAALEPRIWRLVRGPEAPPPHRIFSLSEVVSTFRSCGFYCSKKDRGLILPYRLHRLLRWPRLSRLLESGARAVGLTSLLGSPASALFEARPSPSWGSQVQNSQINDSDL